ncbi:hypothetical protein DCCM_3568 [Desulfocucumis palustris]|uniref:Uncharacterized protein n=1 Tax=Desulfocucumis palustris TaxID=1898651 RepID=A0A2L2XE65_9FIRM|nr:hypothetical protein DCCM_3568 [Desulfocucumis palustris]
MVLKAFKIIGFKPDFIFWFFAGFFKKGERVETFPFLMLQHNIFFIPWFLPG